MELAADEFASLQQMSAVEAFEYLKEAKRKRDEMGVEVHPQVAPNLDHLIDPSLLPESSSSVSIAALAPAPSSSDSARAPPAKRARVATGSKKKVAPEPKPMEITPEDMEKLKELPPVEAFEYLKGMKERQAAKEMAAKPKRKDNRGPRPGRKRQPYKPTGRPPGRPRKDRSASSQDNPVSTSTLSSSAAVPPGQVAQSSTSSTAAATLPPSPPPSQPQTFMPSPPLVSSPNPPTLAPISPDRPPLPDTPDEYHDELDGTPMPLPSEHEEVLARWRLEQDIKDKAKKIFKLELEASQARERQRADAKMIQTLTDEVAMLRGAFQLLQKHIQQAREAGLAETEPDEQEQEQQPGERDDEYEEEHGEEQDEEDEERSEDLEAEERSEEEEGEEPGLFDDEEEAQGLGEEDYPAWATSLQTPDSHRDPASTPGQATGF